MAGQAKWTDGSPVNVGPCFERNGGNIRDLFLFPIDLRKFTNESESLAITCYVSRIIIIIFFLFVSWEWNDFDQMSDISC